VKLPDRRKNEKVKLEKLDRPGRRRLGAAMELVDQDESTLHAGESEHTHVLHRPMSAKVGYSTAWTYGEEAPIADDVSSYVTNCRSARLATTHPLHQEQSRRPGKLEACGTCRRLG
jgi:hypothetical protein